jgi:hypothetical protein
MTSVAAAGGFPCEPLGLEALAVLGSSFLENAFCYTQVTASQKTAPARGALRPYLGVYAGGQPGMVLIVGLQAAGGH